MYITGRTTYDGDVSVSRKGHRCVKWSSFQHDYSDAAMFPDDTVEEALNYCR